MRKQGKITVIALIMVCGVLTGAFCDSPLKDLQNGADEFADSLAKSLPFNSTIGLNWSDAYIGQLIGAPPHFGVGLSGGITTMDFDVIEKLLGNFSISMPSSLNPMILPGYTVDLRVGGFLLPFDVGLKFGILPEFNMGDNFQFDYMLVGGDVRYALLKGNAALPKLSLGIGVNYLSGGVKSSVGEEQKFDFPGHVLELSDSDVGLSWSTTTFDLKAQVSKTFFIVTPYLGLGTSFALSNVGYTVDTSLTDNGGPIDVDEIKQDMEAAGISGIDIDGANGFSSSYDTSGWGLRVFGGFSLNIAVIKFDFTGMFNFLDQNYGGSFGIRFQL